LRESYLSAVLHGFAAIIVADRGIGHAGRAKSRARVGNTISASSVLPRRGKHLSAAMPTRRTLYFPPHDRRRANREK